MLKFLLISTFLLLTLNARENPFFASVGQKDITYSSNEDRAKEPLKRATITLPNQARILKKVTVEYKNLDGSIEKKSIELDNSVDWHLPIFISQNINTSEPRVDRKRASVKKPKTIKTKYKKLAKIKYLTLYSSGKNLKIITKDEILRDFLLVEPHRIVIDFKRDSTMKSYSKNNNKCIFKKVRIGNHSGYYRTVIELDGLYRYTMKKIKGGYLLELR